MSDISEFLKDLLNKPERAEIFGPKFQSFGDFCGFLDTYFGDHSDVHGSIMRKEPKDWGPGDFQAFYVACWIYKPMEKGTYFLRLTQAEAKKVKPGFEALPTRKSSHLDGKGRSAHQGWAFLKGYDELLVQWKDMGAENRVYLMLKCEGHTTGIGGIVPHLHSWAHKKRHGVGLTANPQLRDLALENNPLVERGAENFSTEYKEFLKQLGKTRGLKKLSNAETSVQDMLVALTGDNSLANADNLTIRTRLNTLINGGDNVNGVQLSPGVKEQFRHFSKLYELENRDEKAYPRFFEEVHVNPAQLTAALEEFRSEDVHEDLKAQTQRRSELLRW